MWRKETMCSLEILEENKSERKKVLANKGGKDLPILKDNWQFLRENYETTPYFHAWESMFGKIFKK